MHVNTLISFIWLGAVVLIFGALIAMWPEVAFEEAGAWGYVRAAAVGGARRSMFGILLGGGAGDGVRQPMRLAAGGHPRPAARAGSTPRRARRAPRPTALKPHDLDAERFLRALPRLARRLRRDGRRAARRLAPAHARRGGMDRGGGPARHPATTTERRVLRAICAASAAAARASRSPTCTCGIAAGFRDEVRGDDGQGPHAGADQGRVARAATGPQALAVPAEHGREPPPLRGAAPGHRRPMGGLRS